MTRTVFTATADGSIMVTRESRIGVSGSSKDRRKKNRNGIEETWRVTNRIITRLPLHRVMFQGYLPQSIHIIPTAGVTIELPELPGPAIVTPYQPKLYISPVVVVLLKELADERNQME